MLRSFLFIYKQCFFLLYIKKAGLPASLMYNYLESIGNMPVCF